MFLDKVAGRVDVGEKRDGLERVTETRIDWKRGSLRRDKCVLNGKSVIPIQD